MSALRLVRHPWAQPIYDYVQSRSLRDSFSAEDVAQVLKLTYLPHGDRTTIGQILQSLCHCSVRKGPEGTTYSRPVHMPEPPSVFL